MTLSGHAPATAARPLSEDEPTLLALPQTSQFHPQTDIGVQYIVT